MKGVKFSGIRVTLFVLPVFFSILFLSSAYAQGIDNLPHAMGLIFMTPEERAAFQQTHGRVVGFRLSNIGLERVNEVRAELKLPQLPEASAVPFGEDVISTIGGGGSGVGIAENGDPPPLWGVDNSLLPAFPPIRSQGMLGSCTCFAIAYYQCTYTAGLIYGWDHTGDLEKDWQFSPKWNYNMVNGGVNEGSRFDDNYLILERHGGARWSDFPYYYDRLDYDKAAYEDWDDNDYRDWCTDPAIWESAIRDRTNPVQYIEVSDVNPGPGLELIKEALINGHIVTFGSRFSCWRYTTIQDAPGTEDDYFNDNIYPVFGKPVAFWLKGDSTSGHAITIVGYNDDLWTDVNNNGTVDDGELGALRIANSWGTWWNPMFGNNDRGFTWLAYDALKATSSIPRAPKAQRIQGAITTGGVFLLTLRSEIGNEYSPRMLAKFNVSHIERDQLRINLGISDVGDTVPSVTWFPGAINFQGGPYVFDLTSGFDTATFVFDITDICPVNIQTKNRYYLGICDSYFDGNAGTLDAYSIKEPDAASWVGSTIVPLSVDDGWKYSYVDYGTNSPPTVTITSPADGSTFGSGALISFLGTADDPEQGDLTASLTWISSINGSIGTGGSFTAILSDGSHIITASAIDAGDATGSDSVNIIVGEPVVKVADIQPTTQAVGKGGKCRLSITVGVEDGSGQPLDSADVSLTLYEPDGSTFTDNGLTTDGTVTFEIPGFAADGTYIAEVTYIQKTGYSFNTEDPNNTTEFVISGGQVTLMLAGAGGNYSTQLLQNYENPFNPETWIPFKLGEDQYVVIKIYDMAGQLVRTLDLGPKAPGAYLSKEKAAYWNGRNESGEQVASGIYFYLMEAGSFRAMKKFVIAK